MAKEASFLPEDSVFLSSGKAATLNGESRTALHFWRWSYSDLMQNITRGYVAQYIVAWAIGADSKPNDPWRSYDVLSPDGKTRIEVKSTAFLQAWTHGEKTRNPLFVLEPRLPYSNEDGLGKEPAWNADVYILSFFFWDKPETANIMNLDQWKFWVFTQDEIVLLLGGRKSLTVRFLDKLQDIGSVSASELGAAIQSASMRKAPLQIISNMAKRISETSGGQPRGRLNEKSFFEIATKKLDTAQSNGLWQIYNYCRKNGEVVWGTSSFSAIFPMVLERSLFSIYTDGGIQLYYGYLDEPHKSNFIMELSGVELIKEIFSEKKGSPMCKDQAWLKAAVDFIRALEKVKSG